jgi:hypothetical protein
MKKLKAVLLFIFTSFIYILHLPFAIAKSATASTRSFFQPGDSIKMTSATAGGSFPGMKSAYDSLHLGFAGLSQQAYEYAKKGFDILVQQGKVINDSIIAIVDFSLPSNKKRLFVLDLKNYKVIHNTLVAHGRNSGREMAESFSNQAESYKSSPGFYVTRDTYTGKNGYSLRLDGLERGINDRALERTIVMHGADYVNQEIADGRGFIGRSWGCPAVPVKDAGRIINTLKNGACLFIYTPGNGYLSNSTVLN